MFTWRFEKALEMAIKWHSKQKRKCSDTPYISHLMSVASVVMEYGGDESAVVVALLHDAIEDCSAEYGEYYIRGKIRNEFGQDLLDIIEELTETDEDPKPPWRQRKEKYIQHLYKASPTALLVAAADKLHNARTTLSDLREKGPKETWSKFNADPASQEWWYNQLLVVFKMTDTPRALVNELEHVVDQLFDGDYTGPDEIPERYKDVLKLAEEYNNKLRADHPGFSNGHSVYLHHYDGVMMQRSAFYQIWGQYIAIFGEHMPPMVHHLDEVHHYAQFYMEYPKRPWLDDRVDINITEDNEDMGEWEDEYPKRD